MSKIKISIISDSVSMPRECNGDNVYINETWSEILNNITGDKYRLYNFSARSRTTNSLINSELLHEAIELVNPDILIIQLGIVDCSPRIFSNFEKNIIFRSFFPKFLRLKIVDIRKRKNKVKNIKKYHLLVDHELFEKNLSTFLAKVKPKIKILLIPIIGDFNILNEFRPAYKNNIQEFNQILKSFKNDNITFLDNIISKLEPEWFCKDGYHLSKIGHIELSNIISKKLYV